MSDPHNPASAAARPRPSTVTVAGYLLYLAAALQLIGALIALPFIGTINDVYEEAYAGSDLAGAGAVGSVTVIAGAVIGLIVAIGLVVLALLNNRGKNPARIVTWVLGGLFLCCSIAALSLSAAGSALSPSSGDANLPDEAEVQRMLDDRLPGWYTPVTTLVSVLTVIAVLVALILLALPPSNEFFRKPQPVWQPPVPGSAYPGFPQAMPPAGPQQWSGPGAGSPPVDPSGGDPDDRREFPPSAPPPSGPSNG
ncbi:hypothetical protein OG792_32550 [Micromonospora sp. NBC_01699]|uniref:hypothetical protein n=1 Tax=Micromonospora sp. NBC_01699 TaxID=2975984 RepID=UPI002E294887|nr:hypothetical protein [Micromonospora sp. NBC_01699]